MSVAAQTKRLDGLERQMGPVDWAVWLVDEARRHESQTHFVRSAVRCPRDTSPFMRPKIALEAQAEDAHAGRSADAVARRRDILGRLLTDYQFRFRLFLDVNAAVGDMISYTAAEIAAVRATVDVLALRQTLARIVAVRKAKGPRNAVNAPDDGPQTHLLLKASDLPPIALQQPWRTSSRPGIIVAPEVEETWQNAVVIAQRVLAFRAAVEIVEGKHFRNHPILYRDVDAALSLVAQAALDVVSHFNSFVAESFQQIRERFDARDVLPIVQEAEGLLTIDPEHLGARAREDLAPELARRWIREAWDLARVEVASAIGDSSTLAWELLRQHVADAMD